MAGIEPYVRQAKAGEEIDGDSFKASYDAFLKKIEDPWTGAIKILFIRIPKEWFKGSLDGVRYIEDEPYALYSAALEYQDKRAEQASLRHELEASVGEQFEADHGAERVWLFKGFGRGAGERNRKVRPAERSGGAPL